jgi:copper oxidase (laccase) domain-containing protein
MDALEIPRQRTGPFHADLRDVLARQAEAHGVGTISTSQYCSAHDPWFHSHRASGGKDGRMVAYIAVSSEQ